MINVAVIQTSLIREAKNMSYLRYLSARQLPISTSALALLLLLGCTSGEERGWGQRPEGPAPPVEVVAARSGSLPLEERLSGVVKARNQVTVHAEISAPVVAVLVESGETVSRGQTLVRLDDATLADQLRQAEASVRLAEASARAARARVAELEAQVRRTRALAADELTSELELETQEAQLDAAVANAEQAEARVDEAQATTEERRSAVARTEVRSPVAGRVGQRTVEVGMLVDSNTPLFIVGSLDTLRVEVPLTEEMLSHVREGQSVRIASQALDEPARATVSRISPFLAQGSFSTTGEIDLQNPGDRLRPGMFVTVDILYGESEEATLVPTSALWEDPRTGVRGIYVVELPDAGPAPAELSDVTHPVSFRPVEVLAEGRSTVGIRGAEPGEWVVTTGQQLLGGREAARIRAAQWEKILELQELQREDLLEGFLAKQQRIARTHGAEPPSSDELLDFYAQARESSGAKL